MPHHCCPYPHFSSYIKLCDNLRPLLHQKVSSINSFDNPFCLILFHENVYSFYWNDKQEWCRDSGVAFAIKNYCQITTCHAKRINRKTESPSEFQLAGNVSWPWSMSIPQLWQTYSRIRRHSTLHTPSTVDKVPTSDKHIVLGDMNARDRKEF